jgi:hypothetical protein
MTQRHTVATKQKYFKLIAGGASQAEAARAVGAERKTVRAWEANMRDDSGRSYREMQQIVKQKGPIEYDQLTPLAKACLDDFELFRRTVFGRLSSPWQIDAAEKFRTYLESPNKDWVVLNCPPGAGKSTLLHDIEAWLTCRNRAIRGLLGSKTQRLATDYSRRLKRTLERPRPPSVDEDDIAAGRAVQPEFSCSQLFGRFQPEVQDVWRAESFVVAQLGDVLISEKEATWNAFGLDTEYLGNRVAISVWDDACTVKDFRTIEAVTKIRLNWDTQAENRIEPGGALFLVGQRLGPDDLYRYCLDKPGGFDGMSEDDFEELMDERSDDDDVFDHVEINPEGPTTSRKYHHVMYPAHDETKCTGDRQYHSFKKPIYWSPDDPHACLLDPHRLSWMELRSNERHNSGTYRTVYQQEDVDENDSLVKRIWVTGGETPTEFYPGCYDDERGLAQVPEGLSNRCLSIVTVDPSPTMYWSVQWWLYDPLSQFRHLMDLENKKMGADAFLDFNPLNGQYSGLIDSWAKRARTLGHPIRHLIVERNGAQRFMLKYRWYQQWLQQNGMMLHPHDTTTNKSDEEFGVQTVGNMWRLGLVRLPNLHARGDMGFVASRKLVDEVCVYPNGALTDNVMAYWFLEYWIPRLNVPRAEELPIRDTPHWLNSSMSNLHRGVA